MASAAEHFAWARTRALEYVDLNRPHDALASLVLDLGKHAGTAQIVSLDLYELAVGELVTSGAAGIRRFVEGLAGPAVEIERPSFTCPLCGRTSYNPTDRAEGYCGACHDWTGAAPRVVEEEGPRDA